MALPTFRLRTPQRHDCWRWCVGIGPLKTDCDFRRDVTLGEDHCQVRKGAAPLVLAALNSLVLAVFDFLWVGNVPQQMRRLDAHPAQAVRLVLGSLLTIK